MDVETKLELLTKSPIEEVITPEELRGLLETKDHPVAYDGFEPSGVAHIATGLLKTIILKRYIKAGVKFKLFIADWHAWINGKMGGDLERIKEVGKYFQTMWGSFGIDKDDVEYVWASDIVPDPSYWSKVINIAKVTTLQRTRRCMPIMGRTEDEAQYTASLFYPMMQAADIFHLGVDICQLGADQRHANILAREVGPKLGFWKPVLCHHRMLVGLSGPEKMGIEFSSKMSKSKPNSAIYVHDSPDLIKKKISQAFCPEKQVEDNPLMEYAKYLVFPLDEKLKVHRPAKFGGDVVFYSPQELEKTYLEGKLHPMDLKNSVAEALADLLKPCREYFERHPEPLEVFKSQAITR